MQCNSNPKSGNFLLLMLYLADYSTIAFIYHSKYLDRLPTFLTSDDFVWSNESVRTEGLI